MRMEPRRSDSLQGFSRNVKRAQITHNPHDNDIVYLFHLYETHFDLAQLWDDLFLEECQDSSIRMPNTSFWLFSYFEGIKNTSQAIERNWQTCFKMNRII